MQLQHVSIGRTADSDELTRTYYGNLLGLTEKTPPNSLDHLNLIWFQLAGNAEIHIFIEDVDLSSGQHFCLVVDDVQVIRDRLDNAGYETWDVDEIPGRPRFFTRDPSGNMLELCSIEDDYLKHQAD